MAFLFMGLILASILPFAYWHGKDRDEEFLELTWIVAATVLGAFLGIFFHLNRGRARIVADEHDLRGNAVQVPGWPRPFHVRTAEIRRVTAAQTGGRNSIAVVRLDTTWSSIDLKVAAFGCDPVTLVHRLKRYIAVGPAGLRPSDEDIAWQAERFRSVRTLRGRWLTTRPWNRVLMLAEDGLRLGWTTWWHRFHPWSSVVASHVVLSRFLDMRVIDLEFAEGRFVRLVDRYGMGWDALGQLIAPQAYDAEGKLFVHGKPGPRIRSMKGTRRRKKNQAGPRLLS
jgi:hypothetical protein